MATVASLPIASPGTDMLDLAPGHRASFVPQSTSVPAARTVPLRALIVVGAAMAGLCVEMAVNGVQARSVIFVLVAITAVMCVRFELSHPYTWFIPVFALYSLSAPNLGTAKYLGDLGNVAADAVLLEYVALFGFLLGALPTRVGDYRRSAAQLDERLVFLRLGAMPLFALSSLLTVGFVATSFHLGANKEQIALAKPMFWQNQAVFSLLLLAAFTLITFRWLSTRKLPKLQWILLGAWFLLISVISSERDIFLRFALASLIAYHIIVRRVSVPWLFTFGALGIALVGLGGVYRTAISTGASPSFDFDGIVGQSLGGEFSSASQNLMVLLQGFANDQVTFKWGQTFVSDLQYLLTGSMFSDRQSLTIGGVWFNREFFPVRYDLGGGSGFTLVGEAYLNFGVMGVVVFFFALGLTLAAAHRRTDRATPGVVYALMIPGILYAIRGDLATVLAYTVRQLIVPALLLLGAARLVVQATRRKAA